jgi:hypothetical protein
MTAVDRKARAHVALPLAACVSLTGCGRLGFDDVPDGSDVGLGNVFAAVDLPPGGTMSAIMRTPDGTLYATAGETRVFKSVTSGVVWTECGSLEVQGDVHKIVIDPTTGVLYSNGDNGVSRSVDGCATWQDLGFGQSSSGLAMLGPDVLAGSSAGVWRWTGDTWTPFSTPMDALPISDLAVDSNGQRIFVATSTTSYAALARSINGGAWTVSTEALAGPIALDPVRSGHVFAQLYNGRLERSSDGGASWTDSTAQGNRALAIDPASPDFVVHYEWGVGLNTSSGGGSGWSGVDRRCAEMQLADVEGVEFGASSQLFAATERGMFVAADHNLSWTEIDSGIAAWTIDDISVDSAGALLLATPAGVLRSGDGGASWTEEPVGVASTRSSTTGLALSTGATTRLVTATNALISRSIDGGAFTTLWTAPNATDHAINRIHIVDGRIIASTWAGVVTSDPGDPNWSTFTHHDVAGAPRNIDDVIAIDAGGTRLFATSSTGLYYSIDSGSTFTPVSDGMAGRDASLAGAQVHRIAILVDGTLLAGTDHGAYRSTSQVGPWTASGLDGDSIADLLVAQGRVIAATSDGVFVSDDGAAWTRLPGLEHKSPRALAVDHTGRLLVGTSTYGLFATPLP